MNFLIGSARQLRPVWRQWWILAKRDKQAPEFVEHSAQIYGTTGSGKIATIYPPTFKPAWIAHDTPLLAAR